MLNRRHVGILLMACIGLRLTMFGILQPWAPGVETQHVLQGDALGYHELATSLIGSHRFGDDGSPNALRTPLYPMFVAAIYGLFGYRPWLVLLAQSIIDTGACFLLLVSLSRLFNHRVGLIASAFYALDPFLILYSATALLSDTLFVFLLIVAFWFFSLGRHADASNKAPLYYGWASLFLGLATLTRPIAQFSIVCFLLAFALAYRKRPRLVLEYSLLSVVVFGLTLSPWLFRNYRTFGVCSLSTSPSYNLLILDVVPMEMIKRGEDAPTVRESLLAEALRMSEADGYLAQDLSEFQAARYWRRLAIKYIREDPMAFGKGYLRGVGHAFLNLDTTRYARSLGLPAGKLDIKAYAHTKDLVRAFIEKKGPVGLVLGGVIALCLLCTYLGAVIGLSVSWTRYGDRPMLVLILLFVLYFVLLTGAAGLARLKLPTIPFYLVFTGIGFDYLVKKYSLRT